MKKFRTTFRMTYVDNNCTRVRCTYPTIEHTDDVDFIDAIDAAEERGYVMIAAKRGIDVSEVDIELQDTTEPVEGYLA